MLGFRDNIGRIPYDRFLRPTPRPDEFLPFEESISDEVLFPRTIYAVPRLLGRCRGRVRCRTLPYQLVVQLTRYRPNPPPLSPETLRSPDPQLCPESADTVDPSFVTDRLSFGLRRLIAGQIDESIRIFKEVASAYPLLHVVHRRLGLCYIMNHEETLALEVLLKARALQPRDVKTWFLLGVCHLRLENVVMASLCLSRVIDSCFILLDVARVVSDQEDSKERLHKTPIRIWARPTILSVFNALVVRAYIYHHTGDPASASNDLLRAHRLLETVKTDFSSLPVSEELSGLKSYTTIVTLNLALAFIRVKETASARELVTRLLREIPQHPHALFIEGLCLEDLGDLETALSTFSRSYEMMPRPGTLFKRAECSWKLYLSLNGNAISDSSSPVAPALQACLKDLESASTLCSESDNRILSRVRSLEAVIFLHRRNPKLAAKHAQDAIQLDATNSVAWKKLASLARPEEAWKIYRSAIKSAPHEEYSFLMVMALQNLTDDRKLELLSRVLELRPMDPSVLLQRGDVLSQRNRLKNAVDDYTEVLKTVGLRNRGEILVRRAGVLMRMNDLHSALSDLNDAAIGERCLRAYVLRAQVLHLMEKSREAIQDLTNVIHVLMKVLKAPPTPPAGLSGDAYREQLKRELSAAYNHRAILYGSLPNQFELAYLDFRKALVLYADENYTRSLAEYANHWMRDGGEVHNLLRAYVQVSREYLHDPDFPTEAKECLNEILKAHDDTQMLLWTWERYFITTPVVDNALATRLRPEACLLKHVFNPESEEDMNLILRDALGKRGVCVAFVTSFWMWNDLSDLANEFYASVDFVRVTCLRMRLFAERLGVLIYPTYQLRRLDGCAETLVSPKKEQLREKLVRYVDCL